jgi:hypothetical protein
MYTRENNVHKLENVSNQSTNTVLEASEDLNSAAAGEWG